MTVILFYIGKSTGSSSKIFKIYNNYTVYVVIKDMTGIYTGLQIAVIQEGEIRRVSLLLMLFSTYVFGRGNQPQGWKIPVLPTL